MITDRIDRITLVADAQPVMPAPKSVKIEVSPRCNYRCSFCALRTRQSQPKHDMDLRLFRRITMQMQAAGVEEIGVFYLGESLMNPDLLAACIRWCKKDLKIPYVFLTSNASLACPDAVKKCMDAGLDSLKWSVNAADDVQFESVMQVNRKLFHVALSHIAQAWEVRNLGNYPCRLYASSIRFNDAQLEKLETLLDKHVRPYIDQHYWLPLYGSMTHWDASPEGFRPTAGNQGRVGALRPPLPCWSAFSEGHVTADGILTACCFDSDGRFAMDDLTHTPFIRAWNNDKFQSLRKAHIAKNVNGTICEKCIAWNG